MTPTKPIEPKTSKESLNETLNIAVKVGTLLVILVGFLTWVGSLKSNVLDLTKTVERMEISQVKMNGDIIRLNIMVEMLSSAKSRAIDTTKYKLREGSK